MKPLALVFALWMTVSVSHAAGTIETFEFYSDAMDSLRSVSVYLPEGYDDTNRSYPVVYLLHGCVCDYRDDVNQDVHWFTWYWNPPMGARQYLDNNIGNGSIQPVIVVHPDGCSDVEWSCGSYWTNSELYGPFEDLVVEDVVTYIDSNYRTIPRRNFRMIAGISMGGYGAAKLGLKHPDVFAAIGSIGGVPDLMVNLTRNQPDVCSEYPGGPPRDYTPENQGSTSRSMFSKAGSFSPNLDNPPYKVDFPYDPDDENCALIPSVVERWVPHDASYLAGVYAPDQEQYPLCIWLGCGTEDPRMEENLAFAAALDENGIPYVMETYPGAHNYFPFWSLDYFLDPYEATGCALVSVGEDQVGPNIALQVLPNPSHASSVFQFSLPQAEPVSLIVYDVNGRAVRRVYDGELGAGLHALIWDGRNDMGITVAGGVYFVALHTGSGTKVMRTVRLK